MAELCHERGYYLQAISAYAATRPYCERALAIDEQALGDQHPDTANSLNNLAVLCAREGGFAEATRLIRRALAIREQSLGPNHPDIQRSRCSRAAIEQRIAEEAGTAAESPDAGG